MFFTSEKDIRQRELDSNVEDLLKSKRNEFAEYLAKVQKNDLRYGCASAQAVYGTMDTERLYQTHIKKDGCANLVIEAILENLKVNGISPETVVSIVTQLNGEQFKTVPYFYLMPEDEMDEGAEATMGGEDIKTAIVSSSRRTAKTVFLKSPQPGKRNTVDLKHSRVQEDPLKVLTTIVHESGHESERTELPKNHRVINGQDFTPSTEAISTCASIHFCHKLTMLGLVDPKDTGLIARMAHQQAIFNWVTKGKII